MGSEILILLGTITLLFFIITLAVFVASQQKRVLKKDLAQKDLEHTHQIKLVEAKIETQENERKQIAEKLHDDIAPILATANLYVNMGLRDVVSEEHKKNQEFIRDLIEDAIKNIRLVSHLLHPIVVDTLGIKTALEDLAYKLNKTDDVQLDLNWNIGTLKVDKFNELALFRLLQELIMNALKHGDANEFTMSVNEINDSYHFNIEHNGNEFNNEHYELMITKGKGIGLKNIANRLQMLEGTIEYKQNILNSASVILLIIPVKDLN